MVHRHHHHQIEISRIRQEVILQLVSGSTANYSESTICKHVLNISLDDFEARFSFNTDLPPPEPYKDFQKTYPSQNKNRVKGKTLYENELLTYLLKNSSEMFD